MYQILSLKPEYVIGRVRPITTKETRGQHMDQLDSCLKHNDSWLIDRHELKNDVTERCTQEV